LLQHWSGLAAVRASQESFVLVSTLVPFAAALVLWLAATWLARAMTAGLDGDTAAAGVLSARSLATAAVGVVGIVIVAHALADCVWQLTLVLQVMTKPSGTEASRDYFNAMRAQGVANLVGTVVRILVGAILAAKPGLVAQRLGIQDLTTETIKE